MFSDELYGLDSFSFLEMAKMKSYVFAVCA